MNSVISLGVNWIARPSASCRVPPESSSEAMIFWVIDVLLFLLDCVFLELLTNKDVVGGHNGMPSWWTISTIC
jgi:hypothetical protein